MSCDCEALAAEITVRQASIVVHEAAVYLAQQQLAMEQMQLWYAQNNFYLCGCGGSSMQMAEVEKAILERDSDPEVMKVLATKEPMLRMHRLVVAQITDKRK
jgi:hypothetical protein